MRENRQKKKAADGAISRRGLLTSAAFVPVAALVGAQAAEAQGAAPVLALDIETRDTLAAFVERIVPRDETGPGAYSAGFADLL